MPLISLKQGLAHAKKHGYALGAFNVVNLNLLHGILKAAEQQRSPLIINVAEVHLKYTPLEEIAPIVIRAVATRDIPVILNLDHGLNFNTIVNAIKCGFTSVMFDGSSLSYQDNLAQTAEIVKIAHAVGVSVEAELGAVGGDEGGGLYGQADSRTFTDPMLAKEFVQKTDIDCLAVAIGNAHGLYKGEPKLDFNLLQQIQKETDLPLVLHGGSGISDADFRKAISYGIHKINFYTGMSQVAIAAIREEIAKTNPGYDHYAQILHCTEQAITQAVAHQMDIFMSKGKA